MAPSLGLDEGAGGIGHDVMPVADDLGVGVGCIHRGADDAGLAVGKAAHAIECVDKGRGAGIDGGHRLPEGGVGVADGGGDALRCEAADVLEGPVALGCQGAAADEAARAALPLGKDLVAWVDQVVGVLSADVLLGKERAFQEDARYVGTSEVCGAGVDRVGDCLDRVADRIDRFGERGR